MGGTPNTRSPNGIYLASVFLAKREGGTIVVLQGNTGQGVR